MKCEISSNNATHLIIACNPNVDSLTIRAAHYACEFLEKNRIQYLYHHLDIMQYDPLLTPEEIQRRASFDETTLYFQKLLSHITTLGLFFPDWCGLPPALLVGWLQRVFAPSTAFVFEEGEFGEQHSTPLLTHIRVVLAITSDEVNNAKLHHTCNLLEVRVFAIAGINRVQTSLLANTHNSIHATRNQWLKNTATILAED